MQCRSGCGACCIAPSISSSIPGMPKGKPAGMRCAQLDENNLCRIFAKPDRPAICRQFSPQTVICGTTNEYALQQLSLLEAMTS